MPRIKIITSKEGERESLAIYTEILGYRPILEQDQSGCRLLLAENNVCDKDLPCSDVLLVDRTLSTLPGLEIVEIQSGKGCKIPVHCKTITAEKMSMEEFRRAKRLGCHVLRKPVTFEILENWLSTMPPAEETGPHDEG